jgi:hypothetical protein
MVVLGDRRPILEAQGIQFPNIGGAMNDEEHKSSLASTSGMDDHKRSIRYQHLDS